MADVRAQPSESQGDPDRDPDDDSGAGARGEARVVLTTAPEVDTARRIARGLLERRLAACVNLVPGLTSIYRWRGALEEASEVLLVIKTVAARAGAIEQALRELHPYELPECVVLDPLHVEARYLAWLRAESAASDAP